mmetsp:Transcript_28533/g.62104  ORF Transcript_28533/g.62104 Transcript_28533/m.62104 type:complete len:947 (+) Transcript_28533:20-2860(+)
MDNKDLGFDFDSDSTGGPPSPSSSSGVGGHGGPSSSAPSDRPAGATAAATPDTERQILLLMLLAQVCSLHDPTPRTFTVHVLSLFERGILDRESVRFLFDLGLVPGDYQFAAAIGGSTPTAGNLLEWDESANARSSIGEDGAIVPYRTKTDTSTTTVEESASIQVVEGVDSSHLNTGDTAILGVDEDQALSSYRQQSTLNNDPFRDILGDDIEEATRDHRRKIVEKSKAVQIADRRRREMEVQSIKEHLERHDSVLSDEAAADATAAASSNTNGATSSVDGSLRGGPPSSHPRTQHHRQNGNTEAGASWSVSSHPLSLSRYARDFAQIALLASGAFGDVYRARSNFDQTEYAIKRVCFTAAGYDNTTVQTVVREVQCLALLDHPNIVRYYTSWLEPSWMTGGGKEVDIDTVGTEEERGRLLEGVKRLVLLEDGNADDDSNMHENTFGTLENELKQMNLSPRRLSDSRYGKQVDTGFDFDSGRSDSNQAASKARDRLDSRNTFGSISIGQYGDSESSFSDWSDEVSREKDMRIKRDFSVAAGESTQDSIPSVEGGERSVKDRPWRDGQAPYRKHPPRQHNRSRTHGEYKYRICLFVQMQLCRPSTLSDWIQARNRSMGLTDIDNAIADDESTSDRNQPWVEAAFRIFRDIVRGLAHIHSRNIIHRDLKPENIFASLHDEGGIPTFKIGDFGLSKMLFDANGGQAFESEADSRQRRRQQHNHRGSSDEFAHQRALAVSEVHTIGIGTASYAAPEQIKSSSYGPAADIYSMGLILLELFSTIDSLHERAAVFGDCRKGVLPTRLHQTFPEVASLVAACTHPIPSKRPPAKTVRDTIETCMRDYDASPEATVATQKRADLYCAEIKELRERLEEKDNEITKLKRMLAEKDAKISNYRQQYENTANGATGTRSNHVGTFASRRGTRDNYDEPVEVLGVVESTTLSSSDEDY